MEMKRSKLKTRNAVNKSVGLPLREKTNNSNPGSYKNMQPEQNFNSSSGTVFVCCLSLTHGTYLLFVEFFALQ